MFGEWRVNNVDIRLGGLEIVLGSGRVLFFFRKERKGRKVYAYGFGFLCVYFDLFVEVGFLILSFYSGVGLSFWVS